MINQALFFNVHAVFYLKYEELFKLPGLSVVGQPDASDDAPWYAEYEATSTENASHLLLASIHNPYREHSHDDEPYTLTRLRAGEVWARNVDGTLKLPPQTIKIKEPENCNPSESLTPPEESKET